MSGAEEHAYPAFDLREMSTEQLLSSGGDSRHTIHADGRNRYGNAYTPDDGLLSLGSCTSSTVSRDAFDAAHRLHGWLSALEPDLWIRAIDDLYERVRTEIVANIAMSDSTNVDVVVAPSGTDAELIPLLASLQSERDLTNILVGSSEAGSGTATAAAGLHFDAVTPSGRNVEPGTPIDERVASRVRTVKIQIRDADGLPRDESDIDQEIKGIVGESLASGRDVLIHVIAHSKTGVHAPSLETVHELVQSAPDRVNVVVDAAQGRFSRRGVHESLRRGYMTMTTGSKFFGGPPFCAAVLIPRSTPPGRLTVHAFPAAFAEYFTSAMLPRSWVTARASLPDGPNIGVLLRWWAALAEIRDYYSVPAILRLDVLRHIQHVVPSMFARSAHLRLAVIPPPMAENDVERLLESKTTVFPFSCSDSGGATLDSDDLRLVQRRMRDAIGQGGTGIVPTPDIRHHRVELGQPVRLGAGESAPSVLRVAFGARQIARACVVSSMGSTFQERLDSLTEDVRLTVAKLECVLAGSELGRGAA